MKCWILVCVCVFLLPALGITETDSVTVLAATFPPYQEEVLESGKVVAVDIRKAEQPKVTARFQEDMKQHNGEIDLYTLPLAQVQTGADGKAVAFPLRLEYNTVAYSRSVAEKLGIAPEKMPATWVELLRFLADTEEMVKHVAADNLLMVSSRKDQTPVETVAYRILTGNDAAGEQMAELEKIRWQVSETALDEYRTWLAESDIVWAE